MGAFINPPNDEFAGWVKSRFYVDKTGLIQLTNAAIGVSDAKRIVVSRPRRFGKTHAIQMLEAYYSCGCDSRDLFHGLAIENDPSFEKHLNKHAVISLDIQEVFLHAKRANRKDDFPRYISETVNAELGELYPEEVRGNEHSLSQSILAIHATHDISFIFLLDEWDVIYREETSNEQLKRDFTNFLISIFKDGNVSECIELVYMTGIFPIPKLATQSGLNNFDAFTMLDPKMFAEYVGFTEGEVAALCQKFQMPLQEMKCWYEGYRLGSVGPVYCPFSVTNALRYRQIQSYWSRTAAAAGLFELVNSVNPKFQQAARDLLSGAAVGLSVDADDIDLSDVGSLDTALTALVHLGYLAFQDGSVRIPNQEIASQFLNAMRHSKSNPFCKMMARTKELLEKTLLRDTKAVARILQENHETYASVYSYNNENDLACVVISSYSGFAEKDYTFHRELETGKGFADVVFLPRPGKSKALIPILIELRWDKTADTALNQIKEQRYTGLAHGYCSALLVEICYEKDCEESKGHTCIIERVANP